ncbi:MAG TPA: transcription termination/antitermination protein NusG [Phycisphaerae bacterium]|nr:transcription termination/antitermination protein NusG [Phycisphaerae bacterium]HRY68611.1 transcription termination/antitermination protein NusG [Phycisphaerae bacterium]HSA25660.1 transcription termination/antitermination protein NusG [Phycisphaerae bacterium]
MSTPESDNSMVTAAGSSAGATGASQPAPPPATPKAGGVEPTRPGMKWYVLRVASNKEDQVCEALERKVRIEKLENRVGRVLVPTAKEKRMKAGQVRVYEKKLYPGYVFVEMATEQDGSVSENVWFMIKETTGVGDFIGSDNKPTSMREHDVELMLLASAKEDEEASLQGLEFAKGDRVKIKEGSFQNFEGHVDSIDETKGIVTVLLTIFGRATPVDVEYWQLEKM